MLGDSFPRQVARTRRFTCGRPRSTTVSPDGRRVLFLRSRAGDDPVLLLHVLDVPVDGDAGAPVERVVLDPASVGADGPVPPEEAARRERARELGGGVVRYACDRDVRRAVTTLGGAVVVVDLEPVPGDAAEGASSAGGDPGAAAPRVLEAPAGSVDPRLSPDGSRCAVVADGAVWVLDVEGDAPPRRVVGPADGEPDVTWGLAEFVAAEEMGRSRGYWWAPDGDALLVARVDVALVQRWYVADPATPEAEPQVLRYPAAGTADAEVTLHVVRLDHGGGPVEVRWDREALPYLTRVAWAAERAPLVQVQSRDQRRVVLLDVDPATGETSTLVEDSDDQWVELVDGSPLVLRDGSVARVVADREVDTHRVLVVDPAGVPGDGRQADPAGVPGGRRVQHVVTPPGLQVEALLGRHGDGLLLAGCTYDPSTGEGDPTQRHVWDWQPDGGLVPLTGEDGVHGAVSAGGTGVVSSASLDAPTSTARVLRDGQVVAEVASLAERPLVHPVVHRARLGTRALEASLLLPTGRSPDDGGPALPVVLDPYGGPHAQRVVAAGGAYLTGQYLADLGCAVLVVDGRGSPGRGPAWERTIAGDLAGPPLADQCDALAAAERHWPGLLDTGRVAMRGWSFGGYLSALAVLRRPDVVHAAVAGAPVVDWALYDTHYTERYLGRPQVQPESYRQSSLLDDAPLLHRPLLLVHGLADDNVVAAHALRLSAALLANGRPHRFLPLAGVTHVAGAESVTEGLLRVEVEFLREVLDLPRGASARAPAPDGPPQRPVLPDDC